MILPKPFVGFRNLDSTAGAIAAAMESQALYDHGPSTTPGLVALVELGAEQPDEHLLEMAARLPSGQTLWAFSRRRRRIDNDRIRVTHVNTDAEREFRLKISHHLGKFVKALPPGTPLSPHRLPFPDSGYAFASDESYRPPLDRRTVVTRYIAGVPYEFFSDLRSGSEKLVIFGQSAVTRSRIQLPYFFRWTWAHRIPASVMIWNDPTLYLNNELDAGWWIGSRSRDYIAEAMSIVYANVAALKIRPSDVIFVGLSAGGMSAIPMASLLPGSHALVENPRVTMLADGEKGEMVSRAIQACFGYENASKVSASMRYRIDAMERIKASGHLPDLTYVQNMLDVKHVEPHYRRFRAELEAHPDYDPDRHQFVEYEQWSLSRGGHFPLKEAAMLRIIGRVLRGEPVPRTLTRQDVTRD